MAWHDGTRHLEHDEFVGWKRAKEAFGHLSPISGDLLDRLVARLKTGALEAASNNAKWISGGGSRSTGYVVIVPNWWSGVDGGERLHFAELFKTGNVTLFVPSPDGGSITKVQFEGVRFKPSDLEVALSPQAQVGPLPTAPALRPGRGEKPAADGSGNDISAQEYGRWITPASIVRTLREGGWPFETIARTIQSSLEDGLLRAVAEDAISLHQRGKYLELPRKVWEGWACLADPDFWSAGKLEVFVPPNSTRSNLFRFHRVRFDPDGVRRIVDSVGATLAPLADPIVAAVSVNPSTDTEGQHSGGAKKPVSASTLQAWWTLCTTLKPADQWTQEEMRAFFDRCFPEKSASRDQLRKLRGPQKSGPKGSTAK